MIRRSPAIVRYGQVLGVMMMTFSLVHTPLPQPDFHNIRHHDAPGEVCEFHDHLLRWHPGAGIASDVSVLHWHWFLPSPPGTDPAANHTDDGPAIHAHTITWQATSLDDGPSFALNASESLARSTARPLSYSFDGSFTRNVVSPLTLLPSRGAPPRLVFSATFAPGVSLGTLLHRWDC